MPESNGAVEFTARILAASQVARGQLLVYDSNDGYWKAATAANRAAAGAGAQAIAMTAYGGSLVGKVAYRSTGVVSAQLSGLDPAASRKRVRCSATGYFERIDSVSDGDDIVGIAEPDGRVHLFFGLDPDLIGNGGGGGGTGLPTGWFDVTAHGAVGDNVTNDLPAFQAALAAMGSVVNTSASPGYKTLFIPPGEYFLDGDLIIERQIIVTSVGAAYGAGSACKLRFPANKGIKILGQTSSPNGGNGTGAVIQDLQIYGAKSATAWQASHGYSVGDLVIPFGSRAGRPPSAGYSGNNLNYVFECIKNGTSSGVAEPDWGSKQIPHYGQTWTALTPYVYGNIVRPTLASRSAQNIAFMCTTPTLHAAAGTSGASEPAAFATAVYGDYVTDGSVTWFAFNPAGQTHTDGTVVWAIRSCAGIFADTACVIERCTIDGFQGPGVHIQAALTNYPPTGANGGAVRDCNIFSCGAGVLTMGSDANNIGVENANVVPANVSDKETPFQDGSQLGCKFINCQTTETPGSCFVVTSNTSNGLIAGFYAEQGANPAYLFSDATTITGGLWANLVPTTAKFNGWADLHDWRNVWFKDTSRSVTARRQMSVNVLDSWGIDDHDYVTQDTGYYPTPRAFMRVWANSTGVASEGWTSAKANEGPNHKWYPRGFLIGGTEGTPSDRRFIIPYGLKGNAFFRNGERKVGDLVWSGKDIGTVGAMGLAVTTAGYDGVTWSNGAPVGIGQWDRGAPAGGSPATHVVPTVRNGYVYRCTKGGTTGGVQPTWPTVVGVEARTWTTASLGVRVIVGDYVRPSTPNGHIYEVTAISTYTDFLVGGASEPTWPTTNGNTVTDATGFVTFTCRADDTTTWVADGTAIWTCIGVEATYTAVGSTGGVGGSNGQVLWNNAGAEVGASKLTTDGTYLGVGTAANLASAGDLRFAKAPVVRARNNAGAGNLDLLQTDASDNLVVGSVLSGAKTIIKGVSWDEFWAPQHQFFAADGLTQYFRLSSTVAEFFTDFSVWEPTITHRYTFKQPATLAQDVEITIRDPGVATDALVTEKTTQSLYNKTLVGPDLAETLGSTANTHNRIRRSGTEKTTDATPVYRNDLKYTMVNGDVVKAKVKSIFGLQGASAGTAIYESTYLFEMRSGTVTNTWNDGGSPVFRDAGVATASVLMDVNGADIRPKITGIAATNITFGVEVEYTRLAT